MIGPSLANLPYYINTSSEASHSRCLFGPRRTNRRPAGSRDARAFWGFGPPPASRSTLVIPGRKPEPKEEEKEEENENA